MDGSGFQQEITIDVQIKNKNDNSPVVENAFIAGFIPENSPADSQVLTSDGSPLVISARDSDVGNSQLKYQILNSAVTRYFKIGQYTGEIRTNKVLLPIVLCMNNKTVIYYNQPVINISLLCVFFLLFVCSHRPL
jgi:hypothetical protein